MKLKNLLFSRKLLIEGRLFLSAVCVASALIVIVQSRIAIALEAADPPRHPLTESEAVRLTMSRPALSVLADGTLARAASELTDAGLWPNPELRYARETVDRAYGKDTEDAWWISQRIQISGARGLRKGAASERIDAAEMSVRAERLVIESDTRKLFYRLLHQERLTTSIERWADRMAGMEAVVRKREDAGEVSGYDALRLSRERASVGASLHRELAKTSRLWANMFATLGDPQSSERFDGIHGELLPEQPPRLAVLQDALKNRPDIEQLKRELAALDLERRASERGWIPDLTLGVGRKKVDDDMGQDTGPMVEAGLTVPLFDRGQAAYQRSVAEAELVRSRLQLTLLEAEGKVGGLWQELEGLIAAAIEARRGVEEEATQIIGIAESAYEGGELGVLELLDAYRAAYAAEIQALELASEARLAYIELDLMTGGAVR